VRPKARSLPTLVAAAALIVAAVATGCGGGDKGAVATTTTAATTAGTTTTATTTTTPSTTTTPPATTAGGGQVANGAKLFAANCEVCHGNLGAGGHVGPNLQKSPVAEHLDQVEHQVRKGGGAMPPFSGVLTDQQIDAVAHYVVETIAPKA
jgi:mono/diheme cytochrome c family protein